MKPQFTEREVDYLENVHEAIGWRFISNRSFHVLRLRSRGTSHDEISKILKVSKHHIEHLERNAVHHIRFAWHEFREKEVSDYLLAVLSNKATGIAVIPATV